MFNSLLFGFGERGYEESKISSGLVRPSSCNLACENESGLPLLRRSANIEAKTPAARKHNETHGGQQYVRDEGSSKGGLRHGGTERACQATGPTAVAVGISWVVPCHHPSVNMVHHIDSRLKRFALTPGRCFAAEKKALRTSKYEKIAIDETGCSFLLKLQDTYFLSFDTRHKKRSIKRSITPIRLLRHE